MKIYIKASKTADILDSDIQYFLKKLHEMYPYVDINLPDIECDIYFGNYYGDLNVSLTYNYGSLLSDLPCCYNTTGKYSTNFIGHTFHPYSPISDEDKSALNSSDSASDRKSILYPYFIDILESQDFEMGFLDPFKILQNSDFLHNMNMLCNYYYDIWKNYGVKTKIGLYVSGSGYIGPNHYYASMSYSLYLENDNNALAMSSSNNIDDIETKFDNALCKYYSVNNINELSKLSSSVSYDFVVIHYRDVETKYLNEMQNVKRILQKIRSKLDGEPCIYTFDDDTRDSRYYLLLVSTNSLIHNLYDYICDELKDFGGLDISLETGSNYGNLDKNWNVSEMISEYEEKYM